MHTAPPPAPSELEVTLKHDANKAVIEGKTVVPFQSFVTLVLQRKVLQLFKQWSKEPVIINSELLTHLASAPQDSQENRSNMVMISLGAGVMAGVAGFAALQAVLLLLQLPLRMQELLIITGSIVALGLIAVLTMRMQRLPRGEKIVETMEDLSNFLSSKK